MTASPDVKEAVERLKAADAKIGGVTVHLIRQGAGKDVAKAVVDLKAAAQVLAAEAEALLSELSRLSRLVDKAGVLSQADFIMSGPHLSGHRVNIGFTNPELAAEAHAYLARAAQAHKAIKPQTPGDGDE